MKKMISAIISVIMAASALTTVCSAEELKCDVNGDGYENAIDALTLLKMCTSGESDLRYDMNGDGYVNVMDALYVLKYVVGKPTSDVPDNSDNYEAEVVRLVNAERAKYCLNALSADNEKLNKAAEIRAEEIASVFSHTRPNGTDCFTVLMEQGVSNRAMGENIARDRLTPEEVVEGWLNSSGHRANILNGSYTHIGVGYNENGNNWVQIFIA